MLNMKNLGIIKKEKTAFVMTDLQEKLLNAVKDSGNIIKNANILVKASEILKIPLIITEQYPKGLGKTTTKIQLYNKEIIEKICFSCFGCEEFDKKIKELGIDTLILFGIEAHVCILKTALDALSKGINVHVVADAISSRTKENKETAIERMGQSGVFIASTEMILFQLIDKAGTEEFKKISKLIK